MSPLVVITISTLVSASLGVLIIVLMASTRRSRAQWRTQVKATTEIVRHRDRLARVDFDPETVSFAELWEEEAEIKPDTPSL